MECSFVWYFGCKKFFYILYLFFYYLNLISVHVQKNKKGMEIEYGEKSKLKISGKGSKRK